MAKKPKRIRLAFASATESVRSVLSDLKTIVGQRTRPVAPAESDPPADPQPPALDAPDGEETKRWGRLTLIERVGGGAFGAVYRALDPSLRREIALKIIRLDGGRGASDRESVINEARMLARLRHPHIVTIHDVVESDGELGLCMEFIEGQNLEQILQDKGRMSAREAALIGIDLTRALAEVHNCGLLHRDVKAQNVMREEGGRIVLMDFGLGQEEQNLDGEEPTLLAGTPLYMAPEVLRGDTATRLADIYSLGVLLYRLVTVGFPVQGTSLDHVKAAHASGDLQLLRDQRAELPESYVAIVERAICADPWGRFQTVGALQRALVDCANEVDSGEVVTVEAAKREKRIRRRLAVGLATVSMAAAGVFAGWSWKAPEPVRVIVADAENDAVDSRLGIALQAAAEAALRESRRYTLTSQDQRRTTLGLMRLAATRPVVGAVARDMAIREGARIVISPKVEHKGDSGVVSFAITDPEHGGLVAPEIDVAFSAARGGSDAVDRLVEKLRITLRSLDLGDGPARTVYPRATTRSIEALRAYDSALGMQGEGRMRDALLFLQLAVQLDPEFATAHDALADAYAVHGRSLEAIGSAKTAFGLLATVSTEEEYRIAGNFYSYLGDFEQARSRQELLALLLAQQIAADPASSSPALRRRLARVHRRIGQLSLRLSRLEPMAKSLEQAIHYDESDVVNFGLLAITYARMGDLAAAKRWALEAQTRFPDAAYPYWAWAYIHFAEGDYDAAATAADILARGGGVYVYHAHLLRAQFHSSRGQWAQAEQSLYRATHSLDSESGSNAVNDHTYLEARIAARNGDRPRAVRLLQALVRQPAIPDSSILLRSAATLAIELGEMGVARDIARLVRSLGAEHESPLLRRETDLIDGWIALANGDHERAMALARSADQIMPAPATAELLGAANEASGQLDRAIASYEEFAGAELLAWRHHFPADLTEAGLHLAELHQRRGDYDEARRYYSAFLSRWDPERESDRQLHRLAQEQLRALDHASSQKSANK